MAQPNKFAELQMHFVNECSIFNKAPDMATWTNFIRMVYPKGPVYVIYEENKDKIKGSLHQWQDLQWPSNQKNDPIHRDTYFHVSSYDSNIWILKKEHRSNSSTIKALLKP